MPTNVYFSQKVKSEQNLYEDIIIESLKMYGQDVYYLPREIITEDVVLNEDIESEFSAAYMVEMYIENQDGFEGDGNILAKFGVEIRDQATFIVSKKRWEQLIGIWNNGINSQRPNEGDLIYLPLSNSLFEIRFVEHEQPFYQLSNLPVYKLQCELFEYSGENIETGLSAVDGINQTITAQQVFIIDNSNGTDFIVGETVTQPISLLSSENVTGKVVKIVPTNNPSQKEIHISDWATTDGEYHEFQTTTLTGSTSGAIWHVVDIYEITDTDLENNRAFITDPEARNQELELAADGIIDFSESNPFGEL